MWTWKQPHISSLDHDIIMRNLKLRRERPLQIHHNCSQHCVIVISCLCRQISNLPITITPDKIRKRRPTMVTANRRLLVWKNPTVPNYYCVDSLSVPPEELRPTKLMLLTSSVLITQGQSPDLKWKTAPDLKWKETELNGNSSDLEWGLNKT